MKDIGFLLMVVIGFIGNLSWRAIVLVSSSMIRHHPKQSPPKPKSATAHKAKVAIESTKVVSPETVDSLEKICSPTYDNKTDPFVIYRGGRREGVVKVDSPFKVADRIVPVSFETGNRLLVITGYLHIFREDRVVKRSLKIQDPHLARLLCKPNSNKILLDDVKLDGEAKIDELKRELEAEVRTLVSRNSSGSSPKNKRDKQGLNDVKVAPEPKEVPKPVAPTPAPVTEAPAPPPTVRPVAPPVTEQAAVEPQPDSEPKRVHRPVTGVPHVGQIVSAEKTTKTGANGPYTTFCVTLHDGRVEIPFTGAEIERLYRQQNLRVGDHVRIVSMGRQSIDIPGKEGKAWKNLFQITKAQT